MDPNIYFDASFGGVDLLISSIETEHGRDVAVQSPSRGDKHVLQDRGRKMRSANCTLLFIDQPGLAPYLQRYDQFRALVNAGDAQIFSHPLDGSYRARATEFRVSAHGDAHDVSCTCTFLAEDEPQTIFPIGAGVSPAAGLESVTTAAASANTALSNAGLASSSATLPTGGLATAVPNACLTAVTAWSTAANLDTNKVFLAVAALTGNIGAAIVVLGLSSNLAYWSAYQAMIELSYAVARAGEAQTVDAEQLFDLTVTRTMPLLAICAEVYGAALAQANAPKIATINRVRHPGRVVAGTILKMLPRVA